MNICWLVFYFSSGIGSSIWTFVGNSLGEGNGKKARKYAFIGLGYILFILIILIFLIYIIGYYLIRIYTTH